MNSRTSFLLMAIFILAAIFWIGTHTDFLADNAPLDDPLIIMTNGAFQISRSGCDYWDENNKKHSIIFIHEAR